MLVPPVEDSETRSLRETVEAIVARHASDEQMIAAADAGVSDDTWWVVLAGSVGVAGLAVPENLGGVGGTLHQLATVFRSVGRHVAAGELVPVVAHAATLLGEIGDTRLLPGLAEGSHRVVVAVQSGDESWRGPADDVVVDATAEGPRLSGVRSGVLAARSAQHLLVPVRSSDELLIYVVDVAQEAVVVEPLEGLDLTRPSARVVLDGAQAVLLAHGEVAQSAWDRAREVAVLGLVAELTGAGSRLLDSAAEYAKTRHQFGRAIGGFQAIKHKLADMALDVELLASAEAELADRLERRDPTSTVAAHMAKVVAAESFRRIAAEFLQVHGGIGFTWEHVAHLYLRRASAAAQTYGSPRLHERALGELVTMRGREIS